MKAAWDFTTRQNDLWVEVVQTKYRCGRKGIPNMVLEKSGSSNLWRGLCGVWKGVQHNLIWRYGKGRSINCWDNVWIPEKGKLANMANGPLSAIEASLTVADLVDENGAWCLEGVRHVLNDEVCNIILAMPLTRMGMMIELCGSLQKMGSSIQVRPTPPCYPKLTIPASSCIIVFRVGQALRESGSTYGKWLERRWLQIVSGKGEVLLRWGFVLCVIKRMNP